MGEGRLMLKRESVDFSSSESRGGIVLSRRRKRWAAVALMLVMTTSQGCYTYQSASLPQIQPEEEVRITLEEERFRSLIPGAQQEVAPRIEGRFGGTTAEGVLLRVWIGEAYQGTPFYSTYQNLTVPLDQIRGVEQRRLSRGRTALVVAGTLVTIGALIESLGLTEVFGGGGDDGLPPPPEPEPFFSIDLGRLFR